MEVKLENKHGTHYLTIEDETTHITRVQVNGGKPMTIVVRNDECLEGWVGQMNNITALDDEIYYLLAGSNINLQNA